MKKIKKEANLVKNIKKAPFYFVCILSKFFWAVHEKTNFANDAQHK